VILFHAKKPAIKISNPVASILPGIVQNVIHFGAKKTEENK